MSKYLAFIISCVICIGFDISARQTLLLGGIYLLPCLIIASGVIVQEGRQRNVFFLATSMVSVVYGMIMSVNFGALILALMLTLLLWQLIGKLITLPVSPVVAQILLFFNIWGLLLIVTKSKFGLAQYILYLFLNTVISLGLFILLNRAGIDRSEPKLKYK